MTNDPNRILAIIRSALELPEDYALSTDMAPTDVPGWDSLGWLKVVNAISENLNIELPLDALAEVGSVADLIELTEKTSNNAAA